MNELKPCDARDMWNAVTELEDMALHPSIKKRLSAETLAIAIAAISEKAGQNRRPAPENNPLICCGCAYEPYAPSEEHCFGCARMYGDHYTRKPGQEEK